MTTNSDKQSPLNETENNANHAQPEPNKCENERYCSIEGTKVFTTSHPCALRIVSGFVSLIFVTAADKSKSHALKQISKA